MPNIARTIFIGLSILLIGFIAWQLKTIVLYVAISFVISLIAQPIVNLYSKIKIKQYKLNRGICAALALASIVFLLLLFISLFIPLVVEEARLISEINPNQVVETFKIPLQNIEYDLQKYNINYGNGESLENYLINQLSTILSFNEVSAFAQGIFSFATSFVGALFSILFISFFLIKDNQLIYEIILLLTPTKHQQTIKEIIHTTKRILTNYFLGILADMAFIATLTSIGLMMLGVKNALIIGVFAGVINIIPYIGPIMGFFFALLIGSTTNLDLDFYNQILPLMGKIAIVFLIVQLLDSLLFQPLVISNIVKAHPLEIFLVILIAGSVGGIGWMIIAVPVYTILRIIAKEFLNNFKFVQKLTKNLDE